MDLKYIRSRFTILALTAFTASCAGSKGCAALQPFPDGTRYTGAKTDDGVAIRLNESGVSYLNAHWKELLETFIPNQTINVPVGCFVQDTGAAGNFLVADNGTPGCTDVSCGFQDGVCDAKDTANPSNVKVVVKEFRLIPQGSDTLRGELSVEINTEQIIFESQNPRYPGCAFASRLLCNVVYNGARSGDPRNSVTATIAFKVNSKWDKWTSFDVTSLNGTKVCGASGAPAAPFCLDPNDLDISGSNNCGTVYCGTIDFGPIKRFLMERLSPTIQTRLTAAISNQGCEACGTGKRNCPQFPGASSRCDTDRGVCVDQETQACVPRMLGIEGRFSPGLLLSKYGVSELSQLDLSVIAGSQVKLDKGMSFGTRTGITAPNVAECVPRLPAPAFDNPTAPQFEAEATPGKPFHVAVGISQSFATQTLYQAHQSGALCMGLSNASFGVLNTGLFKTFLPSLGKLATRDGKDAPMLIALRPKAMPELLFGKGTFDAATKKPIDPLMTLKLNELTLEFYALLEDRYVRLFSATIDATLPLSLMFDGCSKVTPALGSLSQVLTTKPKIENSELLEEDFSKFEQVIPTILGLAEPAFGNLLRPLSLPSVGNFDLNITEAKGINIKDGKTQHIALYAQLAAKDSTCTPITLAFRPELIKDASTEVDGEPSAWPVARVKVQAARNDVDYAWRVDGGLWTGFQPPSAQGVVSVSHPAFLLQTNHTIELKARRRGDSRVDEVTHSVDFSVDTEAPVISLNRRASDEEVEVSVRDNVSAAGAIAVTHRFGDAGAFTPLSVSRLKLATIDQQGTLTVRAVDAAGNAAETVMSSQLALRESLNAPTELQGGCATTGRSNLFTPVLVALLALLFRRKACDRP